MLANSAKISNWMIFFLTHVTKIWVLVHWIPNVSQVDMRVIHNMFMWNQLCWLTISIPIKFPDFEICIEKNDVSYLFQLEATKHFWCEYYRQLVASGHVSLVFFAASEVASLHSPRFSASKTKLLSWLNVKS